MGPETGRNAHFNESRSPFLITVVEEMEHCSILSRLAQKVRLKPINTRTFHHVGESFMETLEVFPKNDKLVTFSTSV